MDKLSKCDKINEAGSTETMTCQVPLLVICENGVQRRNLYGNCSHSLLFKGVVHVPYNQSRSHCKPVTSPWQAYDQISRIGGDSCRYGHSDSMFCFFRNLERQDARLLWLVSTFQEKTQTSLIGFQVCRRNEEFVVLSTIWLFQNLTLGTTH